MTTAANLATSRSASVPQQAALYDVAIVSAGDPPGGPSGTDVAIGRMMAGLTALDRRAALVRDPSLLDRQPEKILSVASKLHCIEDRLFERQGGAGFVSTYVSTARRAGRMTGLVCTDLSSVFTNRREIFAAFGDKLDFVVGEPVSVLSLFGLSRIDTLIPRTKFLGCGLVLHRVDYASIVIRPGTGEFEAGTHPITQEKFWSDFVPSALGKFCDPATN